MRLNFYENKPKTKVVTNYKEKKDYTIVITIGIVILAIIVSIIGFNIYKSSKCNDIEDKILKYANEYASANGLLDLNESESVSVNIADIYGSGFPNVTNNNQICYGSVKFTMVDGKIIETLDVTDCSSCSTDQRYGNWKESSTLPSSNIIDVKVAYNYYNAEVFYSKWTSWYPSSKVNTEVSSQFGVNLPSDEDDLPKVPSTAEILKYDVEHEARYSYRDKTWKWYRSPNSTYTTAFYSTAPSGYTNKDNATMKYTEWSSWSLNYPDEYEYRSIRSANGYRWYYLDEKDNKHYYNGGEYTTEKPSDVYKKYDKTATLYSYRDQTWKWYIGSPRGYYSSYTTKAPNGYNYKDDAISSYTSWSSWSSDEPSNESYREVMTDVYYRYRAMYRDVNYLVLDEYLPLEEFENTLGMSLDVIRSDSTKKISYKYTYLYK